MMARLKTWAAVVSALFISACGTLERPTEPPRLASADLIRIEDPRIRSGDPERLAALVDEFETRVAGTRRAQTFLALSGGGANGAYGAGLLYGWTERGDRPVFDVVTGVSTGALAAPFAFLGPDWDDELRHAYVGGAADHLLSARTLSLFRQPSLFSARVLRELVDRHVTAELLAAIADQYSSGRRLLVVTTNLDTQETVIWDMTLLAAEGGPEALTLFRDILVASASIPGVFPPVLIPSAGSEGEATMEMHVDGGVNTPFLAVPEDLLLWTGPEGARGSGDVYVIVNGQVGRSPGVTAGDIQGILSRTYDSMSRASLRIHLIANAAFAERNGVTFQVSAIPDDIEASSLSFDQASMERLFDLGRNRAAQGAWTRLRPSAGPEDILAGRDQPASPGAEELAGE